jgi:hypothetical protein
MLLAAFGVGVIFGWEAAVTDDEQEIVGASRHRVGAWSGGT